MQHQPVTPFGCQAGNTFQPPAFLRPIESNARQRRPERAVFPFHHHHTAAPAVELVAVVFLERAHVAAVGIVEEKTVGIIDDARRGDEMSERNRAAIVLAANPGNHAFLRPDQPFSILRRAIGARRLGQ